MVVEELKHLFYWEKVSRYIITEYVNEIERLKALRFLNSFIEILKKQHHASETVKLSNYTLPDFVIITYKSV